MLFLRASSALLLFALVALVAPVPLGAQIPAADTISIVLTPAYPKPYEIVTISPRSTVVNLAASAVTVSVDGAVVEEGSGTKPTAVQLGGAGTRTLIRVSVRDSEGQTYVKELTLRPSDVALVMEPVSTAHPFYQGGLLVAPEGRVRMVAIADFRSSPGTIIPPASLVYTWKNGDRILQDQSGIGRSVLDATAPLRYRDARISLTVTTQDRTMVGAASVTVSPVDPTVRVYRTGPLLGPSYESAITDTAVMTGTEDTFRAVPYFFSSTPAFLWTVNGTGSEADRDLTVRVTEQGRGTARIGVTAQLPGAAKSASYAFPLEFGGTGSTNIFGI